MKIFQFVKADQFFPEYCPGIKCFRHKINGKNGRGNPVSFPDQEIKQIKKALKEMIKDTFAIDVRKMIKADSITLNQVN